MEKIVVKSDGGTRIRLLVDEHRVFSEDFKRIIQSSLVVNFLKAKEDGRLGDKMDLTSESDPVRQIVAHVAACVQESIPILLADCLDHISDPRNFARELADLGFHTDADAAENSEGNREHIDIGLRFLRTAAEQGHDGAEDMIHAVRNSSIVG